MPKSAKPDTPQFQSWDEVDGAGQEAVKIADQIAQQETEMNAEIATVKDSYKAQIQELKTQQKLLLTGMEEFVEAHKTELASGTRQKSRVLTHVVTGYRTNPPSVAARLKSFAKVLERMLGLGAKAKPYIATKQDIDKSAILDDWKNGKLSPSQLQELGVKIVQDEVFFCEPIRAAVADPDTAA